MEHILASNDSEDVHRLEPRPDESAGHSKGDLAVNLFPTLSGFLHIRPGTRNGTYSCVSNSLLSGKIHLIFFQVTYAMSYHTRDTNTLANRFFLFFNFMMLQAVAVQFEDFVIWCYKAWTGVPKGQDAQPESWHRVVGITWVLAVWCYTAKLAMLACIRNGISAEDSLPFSVVRPTLMLLGVL